MPSRGFALRAARRICRGEGSSASVRRSLTLAVDLARAARSDELADTLDYAEVHRRVVAVVEQRSFDLLERLGAEILDAVFEDARVRGAEVSIGKPGLLDGATATVTLRRSREHADKPADVVRRFSMLRPIVTSATMSYNDVKAALALVNPAPRAPTSPMEQISWLGFADLARTEYDAAHARARKAAKTEPRATSARFTGGKLVLELAGAVKVTIPRDRVPGLAIADPHAIANVKIEGGGEYLRWPDLDVDHSVPILLADVLGIRTARDVARSAGSATSGSRRRSSTAKSP